MNQAPDPFSLPPQSFKIRGVMESDGMCIALWDVHSREMINQAKSDLDEIITPVISRSCMYLKGRGGIKGCIRDI